MNKTYQTPSFELIFPTDVITTSVPLPTAFPFFDDEVSPSELPNVILGNRNG